MLITSEMASLRARVRASCYTYGIRCRKLWTSQNQEGLSFAFLKPSPQQKAGFGKDQKGYSDSVVFHGDIVFILSSTIMAQIAKNRLNSNNVS